MTSRTPAALTATAVLLAVTACGQSPESPSDPADGLAAWAADVEPGWYAVTMACAATDPGTDPQRSSGQISLSGEHGAYGEGDCGGSPVTTTLRFGTSEDAMPETVTVAAEADGHELFWGVSASPTTAPE